MSDEQTRWSCRRRVTFATGVVFVGFLSLVPARPAHACTDGETQPCALQTGVCAESLQTCVDGEWQACGYGRDFEEVEASCDGLDNDCDGTVDIVDQDGDGANACRILGVVNELLLTNLDEVGSIKIFEYKDGAYQESWSATDPYNKEGTRGGGEMGDLDGDGIPEFVLDRIVESEYAYLEYRLEAWKLDASGDGWSVVWSKPSSSAHYVGDIADVDNDGMNELLITDRSAGRVDLYSSGSDGLVLEETVRECEGGRGALFHATIGDLNGNGMPEIIFQCHTPEDIIIQEYDGSGFPSIASVPAPLNEWTGNPMIIDDMETGDVNGDGLVDAVFCGSTGQVYVLSFRNGTHAVEYASSVPSENNIHSQTCSVGDLNGDSQDDILVINDESVKVIAYGNQAYDEIWTRELHWGSPPGVGASAIGDSDNDGRMEFVFKDFTDFPFTATVLEKDGDSFVDTHRFGPSIFGGMTAIIGNLNPFNDESVPADCDDHDPSRGAGQYCSPDYSRPAAGSGGGVGGTLWSDEFTACNTADVERELLFTFTGRGATGQDRHVHTETIRAGTCETYTDPVRDWFGRRMYGAFLIDVADGPASDIVSSGLFRGDTGDDVLGQFFGSTPVEDAVTGDAYILTTIDPDRDRVSAGYQVTRDNTALGLALENPVGTVLWSTEPGSGLSRGDNDLITRLEQETQGPFVVHYTVTGGADSFATITDNRSGDPAALTPATPSTYLVLPVIGKTSGAAGVDWFSEFLIANLTQEPNTVQLNLYIGRLLTGEIELGPGEVTGYNDLVSQIDWRDAGDNPVALEEEVGALEIVAEGTIIAGSKFNSVDRETGRVMGLSLKAMAEPNLEPESTYLFLGVQNEDPTGVVRARLNLTNLTDEDATLAVDVLRQDGTLVGSFEKVARAKRFSDWRIPKSLTEEGETYTLVVTTTQPGYAFLSQINESNDAICNYPLEIHE